MNRAPAAGTRLPPSWRRAFPREEPKRSGAMLIQRGNTVMIGHSLDVIETAD